MSGHNRGMHAPVPSPPPVPVALTACTGYTPASAVEEAVYRCLAACGLLPGHATVAQKTEVLTRGDRVLVKPNLLRASALSCTHPLVIRAACQCLLDHGLRVVVADSPGFGTARGVAEAIGLEQALRPLGLQVRALDDAQAIPLRQGGHWGIARAALESDHILSVPRFKAHCQMRVTLAVKNLFGCICGLRKAVAHTVQGQSMDMFTSGILDLWAALPPVAALVDGVEAMHVTGPSGGKSFALGCVGASPSALALDTACYTLLEASPSTVPLWAAAQQRQLPGAFAHELRYVLSGPEDFDATGFILPELIDISFRPHRLFVSLCRRLWSNRHRGTGSPR